MSVDDRKRIGAFECDYTACEDCCPTPGCAVCGRCPAHDVTASRAHCIHGVSVTPAGCGCNVCALCACCNCYLPEYARHTPPRS